MLASMTTADDHHIYRGVFMVHPNNAGKLLLFPGPAPAPGSAAQEWNVRILETKDNLVSALDYLRIAYNEMLAGRPVKAAAEIVAHVEAILKSNEKPIPFTVVSAIRIRGPIPPLAKRNILLLFPAVKAPKR
jgi:hypothetical protein